MARSQKPLLHRWLDFAERTGNRLPHPVTLFALASAAVLLLSWSLAQFGVSAVHPSTGKTVTVVNLLSPDGIRRVITSLVTNFTDFAPLGTVLVAMLGVAAADGSGLLGVALRAVVLGAPRRLITLVVVFSGILSNAASEAGYVILVPLAGILFLAAGRHPLAGMAAAFAGVSGGYSANLVLGTIDPLLAGITTEAAHIVDPSYSVNPAANYYFMAVSTFLLAAAGTLVTHKVVEPRLGAYSGEAPAVEALKPNEKRGLKAAGVALLITNLILALATLPPGAILRDPKTGSLLHSPFLTGIVAVIFVMFFVPGVAYGLASGSFRKDADVVKAMEKTMNTMGSYIVLVFFAAQFVAFFSWTNLGLIVAIDGAALLKKIGFTGIPLIIAFVLTSAFLNLFMGSASAKWAILAPVFVPMFMLLGFAPELTQGAYRVGDSVTNIVTPMMSYFALIIAFFQRYKPDAGVGTLIATMLPYTVTFLICWLVLLVAWVMLGIPMGPGAELFLETR